MSYPITKAVRAGLERDDQHGAVVPPVHLSSTFTFEGLGRPRTYDYTRSGNPTRSLLGEALGSMEGGQEAVITASGMAAITTALQLLAPGERLVVPHDCYGGTWRLVDAVQRQGRFEVDWVDLTDPARRREALTRPAAMVWVETPSNPLLRITDIAAVRAEAPEALLVVDNTFLSPALQRPLELGADVVVHSTTKYLNGHSDVVGGAVIAADGEVAERLAWWANCLGLTGAPFEAWLTLRGVRTLHARMAQHLQNAAEVVALLKDHPAVARVHYPGLTTHPGHAVARRQQRGFGAMVSFELGSPGEGAVARFAQALSHFSLAESLGGVESLVAHPATMTHAAMSPEARAAAGIADGLVRLSVGIEDPRDLVADLSQALDRCGDRGGQRVSIPSPGDTRQPASVWVLGAGTVGTPFIASFGSQREGLRDTTGLQPTLVGVTTRRVQACAWEGLDPEAWREGAQPGVGIDGAHLDALARQPEPVLVDCTAAEGMEVLYEAALRRGIHVVVANKKALAASGGTRDRLLRVARERRRVFSYEATVGAALPIIGTLQDLLRTGDTVRRIEGSFSGSLGFICYQLGRGLPLDLAVQEAMARGYTEPHPQDDLAGTDAARKALILARELGLSLELSDVAITPLVPSELLSIADPGAFLAALHRQRATLTARFDALCAGGRILRYLAVIDPLADPVLRVGPVAVAADHSAAALVGSQSMVAFSTRRYEGSPLVVQGAGAGGDVTASGVFAEVLRIARGRSGRGGELGGARRVVGF